MSSWYFIACIWPLTQSCPPHRMRREAMALDRASSATYSIKWAYKQGNKKFRARQTRRPERVMKNLRRTQRRQGRRGAKKNPFPPGFAPLRFLASLRSDFSEREGRGLEALQRSAQVVSLDVVDADLPHHVELFALFDSLGDELGVDLVGHRLEGLHQLLLHEEIGRASCR